MLSETIHEFECRRAIQGCFWGFSDRSQAQKHALRCLRAFRVCRRSLGMIFRQVWKNMIFEIFRGFHHFLDFSDPDPIRRSDFQPKNHVLQVLEPQMVRNRSRTTCSLPGTLVGHSKITISLLNSAWFGRYSRFFVWIYLGYQHTECCGWWGGGIMRNITRFFL